VNFAQHAQVRDSGVQRRPPPGDRVAQFLFGAGRDPADVLQFRLLVRGDRGVVAVEVWYRAAGGSPVVPQETPFACRSSGG
jgi:hypothetical protein